MHPLDITFTKPIEREYEAWIVRGIEEYFLTLGYKVPIWAVSPTDEVNWPADESMIVGNKLIGLQIKKATYSSSCTASREYSCLKWTLHQPPKQYGLVLKFPEIYYCLPTFINRNFKDQALAHCLFWRPEPNMIDKNVWYNNPQARTPYNAISKADRWGKFIEDVINCTVGKKIKSISEAQGYVRNIQIQMREQDEQINDNYINEKGSKHYVYIIAVPING